jgi:pimeloyl-ACP methyl ester carboxylesterase
VVLLHGFPGFWYSWRFQIPALAGAGFRVVAPDMRGYNLSDKPEGVKNYGLDLLARDVERLIGALGERRAVVVGHDWGGMVAWAVAMLHPGRVARLAILNVPHPERFSRAAHPAPAPQGLLSAPFQGPLAPREGPPGGRIRPPALRFPQRPGTTGSIRRRGHRPVRRGALAPGGSYGRHKLLPGPRQANARPGPGAPAPDRGAGVGDLGREGPLPGPGTGAAGPRAGPRRPRRAPARREPLGPAGPPRKGQRPLLDFLAP